MTLPPQITAMRASAGELGLLLASWCDQNSGSENFAGLEAMLALLKAQFRRLPGIVEHLPLTITSAEALRIRVRPKAPIQLLFSGHYDTAFGESNPFQQCEFSNAEKMRGPGVIDMKGGLVVMHAALEAFERGKHTSQIGYEVLLTPDKETGSFGSAALINKAAQRHQFGFVFEPARPNGDLVRSRKGTGDFIVTSFGRPIPKNSHGECSNAVSTLTEFLTLVNQLPVTLPGVSVHTSPIRGSGTTPHAVSVFADASLDVSITHPAERDAVLARLHDLAYSINSREEGCKVEISGGFNRPPMKCPPATESVFSAWQQCGQDLALAPFSWADAHRSSDANLLVAAGLPCLDGLGPIGDLMHSAQEWVDLPSLIQRAQVTALFLHRLAVGEIQLPPRAAG